MWREARHEVKPRESSRLSAEEGRKRERGVGMLRKKNVPREEGHAVRTVDDGFTLSKARVFTMEEKCSINQFKQRGGKKKMQTLLRISGAKGNRLPSMNKQLASFRILIAIENSRLEDARGCI